MNKQNNISKEQSLYVMNTIRYKRNINMTRILLGVCFIVIWEMATRLELIDGFIFSSPSSVFRCLINMIRNGKILYHTGVTLIETLVSFIVGTLLGIIIAMGLWWSGYANKVLEPYLVIFNSLPKTALAPVIIVWLGNNYKAIVFTALMISVVVTILNLLAGFINSDRDKMKLIKTFGGNKKDIFNKVVFPSNIPILINTMKVNIGLSLIGVIIGEFLVARAGLGYLIVYGSQVFKMDWVMLSIIVLAFIATFLYQIIVLIEKYYGK